MKTRSWLALTIVLLAGFSLVLRASAQGQTPVAAQRPTAAAAPAGNADNGRKLFAADGCYQCHGYEAQGSSATGPRLGPRPIAFAQFTKYVRAPTGEMPPYTAKIVTDRDLADIYEFLQSRPQPPPVDRIPLLR
jgi:mono/diheme cytochrome c family protein